MNERMSQAEPQDGSRPFGLWWASIVLAGIALILTGIGLFWMRLWLVGLVIGVIALGLAIVAARRAGRRPIGGDLAVLLGVVAVVVPTVIASTALITTALNSSGEAAPAEELNVVLQVTADGDFEVTYTEPVEGSDSESQVVDVRATDEFEVSFTADIDQMQLLAHIAQNNVGPQSISCKIWVDDVLVVDRVESGRSIDCSAALQELRPAATE